MPNSDNIISATKAKLENLDLSSVMLSTYQCLVEPTHFNEMTAILTSWLSETDDPIIVASLETHSNKIWGLLHDEFSEFSTESTKGKTTKKLEKISYFDQKNSASDLNRIAANLCAEDLTRLKRAIKNAGKFREKVQIIVRYYLTLEDHPMIALIEIEQNSNFSICVIDEKFQTFVSNIFARSFKLSNREIQVLTLLVSGNTPKQIANAQNRSVETIRSHIKSLTSKIGVSSQTDLVRMVGETSTLLDTEDLAIARSNDKSSKSVFVGHHVVEYEIDKGDGTPILYCHCLSYGRHWTHKAKHIFRKNGFKTLRVSRAGFAGSSIIKSVGVDLLACHAENYKSVLSKEGIKKCLIFAEGMGFPSAYYFALHYPERVLGIVGLNATPPIIEAKDTLLLNGVFKTAALATIQAPSVTKMISSFAFRYMNKINLSVHGKPSGAPLGDDLTEFEDDEGLRVTALNDQDALQSKGEAYWREATTGTLNWAATRKNANTPPLVRLLQSRDCPFVVQDGIKDFANKIGAPLRTIDSFLPRVSGPGKIICEELGSMAAGIRSY
ncbi:MAG: LuxR C-terminal-related transcriptional regulator [Pseudomonadota bacterium]